MDTRFSDISYDLLIGCAKEIPSARNTNNFVVINDPIYDYNTHGSFFAEISNIKDFQVPSNGIILPPNGNFLYDGKFFLICLVAIERYSMLQVSINGNTNSPYMLSPYFTFTLNKKICVPYNYLIFLEVASLEENIKFKRRVKKNDGKIVTHFKILREDLTRSSWN